MKEMKKNKKTTNKKCIKGMRKKNEEENEIE